MVDLQNGGMQCRLRLAAYWHHTMRRLTPIHTRMHVLTMRRRGVARPANGCLLKHTDKCARCERFIQVLCTVDAHVGGSVQRRNHRAVLARQGLTCWSSSSFLLVVSLLCSWGRGLDTNSSPTRSRSPQATRSCRRPSRCTTTKQQARHLKTTIR